MNLLENAAIKKYYDSVQESMLDYLDSATSYKKVDVKKCMKIMDFYLREMEKAISEEEGLMEIEKTVQMLNLLNEYCGHELIETGQREDLAEIINLAAKEKGYNNENEDLTEKWRAW